MSPTDFISHFKALHDKAKLGKLSAEERTQYTVGRAQLGRMLLVAQQLTHSGQTLRADLRMAKMLKLELRPDDGELLRTSTIDLASGGFAVLLPLGLKTGKGSAFTLLIPSSAGGGTTPISGRCKVASSRPQTGVFRVSFKFDALAPDAQEQLDIALIDAVLERFKSP